MLWYRKSFKITKKTLSFLFESLYSLKKDGYKKFRPRFQGPPCLPWGQGIKHFKIRNQSLSPAAFRND